MWSIGVIAYILLCGSRPFWARTESGIFRAILKTDPNFDEALWPSLSSDAVDFVKRLLNKDYRKRLTAAQALSHPWLAGHHDVNIPLDMIVYKLVKAYVYSSSPRKTALRVMVTNQRSDLQMNIPALRKLDAMLIDCLDNLHDQKVFSYVSKDDESQEGKDSRKDDKSWIPTPMVPPNGLSDSMRKWLRFQKDSVNQVHEAAMAINAQVLAEMEIPES